MPPTFQLPHTLTPHPRLYLSPPPTQRRRATARHPTLRKADREVQRMADRFAPSPAFEWERNQHNAHLLRARHMQCRAITLLVRWRQTGIPGYRNAALEHLLEMGRWKYWSWIAWRKNDPAPDATFDLSYGENCATLALGWDWLHDDLAIPEREALLAVTRRPVAAFMRFSDEREQAWWFGKPDSNWNTVCAGGAGMLALAMQESIEEAPVMLQRSLNSITPFVEEIRRLNGAWPEGIGYWNYGMRYLHMFLLSLERATGTKSPLLRGRAMRESMAFPLRFAPYPGCNCSFGDVNRWSPLPFHFAIAHRLGCPWVLADLDRHLRACPANSSTHWPNAAELLCLHRAPEDKAPQSPHDAPFLKHYRRQDWVVLADRMPRPRLYAAVRGGTTEVPHSHVDLTSFHAVVNDEVMLVNLSPDIYLDTTFSARRWDLFETIPASKNILLIDGVGMAPPAKVRTQSFETSWGPAVRLNATEAIGVGRRENDGVMNYLRLFLLLPGRGLLVVDAVERPHPSLFEQRFFTYADTTQDENSFLLAGQRHQARLTPACTQDGMLSTARPAMTVPSQRQPVMLRHTTRRLHNDLVMAALLSPGTNRATLTAEPTARGGVVIALGRGRSRQRLKLSRALLPC